MDIVAINDGWCIAQDVLIDYSRFYQDLCKETKTCPTKLNVPNLMQGLNPNFQELANFAKGQELPSRHEI